jgi:hypothetical protein
MADKLTLNKRQRIHARELLHKKQGGKCAECGEHITLMSPGVVLAENWRRGILSEADGQIDLICQRCDTIGTDWKERAAEELAAVEALV